MVQSASPKPAALQRANQAAKTAPGNQPPWGGIPDDYESANQLANSAGPSAALPPDRSAFVKKIFEIAKVLPPLAKTETNQHGNYEYVSIDKYFAVIGKACRDAGLLWLLDETEGNGPFEYQNHGGSGSKIAMRKSFSVMLMLEETGDIWPCFRTITMTGPYSGYQTAGIIESYAEKILMKGLFKVVSGEPDADGFGADGEKPAPRKASGDNPVSRALAGEDDPFGGL